MAIRAPDGANKEEILIGNRSFWYLGATFEQVPSTNKCTKYKVHKTQPAAKVVLLLTELVSLERIAIQLPRCIFSVHAINRI